MVYKTYILFIQALNYDYKQPGLFSLDEFYINILIESDARILTHSIRIE